MISSYVFLYCFQYSCVDDIRDDITGLLDELVMNTKELIVETSREMPSGENEMMNGSFGFVQIKTCLSLFFDYLLKDNSSQLSMYRLIAIH